MGKNIRFEMLGLYFCYIGMEYQALQDWDPLFNHPENSGRDRKQTAWRFGECAEVCLVCQSPSCSSCLLVILSSGDFFLQENLVPAISIPLLAGHFMYDANNERQKMCDLAETVNFLVPALIYNFKRLQTGCTGDDSMISRPISSSRFANDEQLTK